MAVPRSIAEFYRLFEKMKEDFENRLSILEASNKSLKETVEQKDIEIKKLKDAEALNTEAMKQQKAIQAVVDNHQNFLEKSDSYRRECNVVIYGLAESADVQDEDQVKEVLHEMQCQDTVPEKYVRLGKVPEAAEAATEEERRPQRPLPLLVVCKSRQDKTKILSNTSKLKTVERFKKVFVKKDQTPYERKEWARLREVLSREKTRPDKMQVWLLRLTMKQNQLW